MRARSGEDPAMVRLLTAEWLACFDCYLLLIDEGQKNLLSWSVVMQVQSYRPARSGIRSTRWPSLACSQDKLVLLYDQELGSEIV